MDVYSFLDARLFLQEIYAVRKKKEPRFSYEIWARQLGVASKSYLRFAVIGKRKISAQLTQKICENLKLDEKECEYFTLLVLYTQCEVAQQKKILGEKLTSLLKKKMMFAPIEVGEDVLAHPLLISLRNYLAFEDAEGDAKALAKVFGLSEIEIDRALEILAREGMIQSIGGRWQSKHDWVKVDGKPGNAALASYHRHSLLRAIEAQALPPASRSYRSLSFALSAAEYDALLKELNEFAAKTCASFDTGQIAGRRIYQLNFNLIPWTEEAQERMPSISI